MSGAGSTINISSASGLRATPGTAAYSASKAPVSMRIRVTAKESVNAGAAPA